MPMPRFSVIVPSYGRPNQLSRCLAGLAALDYPRDAYEVVVVDDGTPSGLAGVVDAWRNRVAVTLAVQTNAGPAAARNRGAQHASYEYLAFIDDDCVPDAQWLTAFARAFERAPDYLLGGHVVNALPRNPYAAASQDLVTYLCGYYDGEGGRSRLFTSNNMAVRAAHFHRIGGFDTTFPRAAGEDRDFCDRWIAEGGSSSSVETARVEHAHALTLRGFCRQHFEYGRAAVRYRDARAARRGQRVRLEPWSFYRRLLGFPLRHGVSFQSCRCTLLFLLAQLANACGFAWQRPQSNPADAQAR